MSREGPRPDTIFSITLGGVSGGPLVEATPDPKNGTLPVMSHQRSSLLLSLFYAAHELEFLLIGFYGS